jgi:deoxyribodipyrimidine photo-lyase
LKPIVNIIWFRRDLRLNDQAALYHALKEGLPVVPIFIFDRNILDELENREDSRVEFIHKALTTIQHQLLKLGSTLEVFFGFPEKLFPMLVEKYSIRTVFANHDYEPYARSRDKKIEEILKNDNILFKTYKDQVVFDKNEILKEDGKPYTIFTPYSRKWKTNLNDYYLSSFPTERYLSIFFKQPGIQLPTLAQMGFRTTGMSFPKPSWSDSMLLQYTQQRDFPAKAGTSKLSVHLRFGTISVRQLAREVSLMNETYLNELIWRDFYHMILWHFPRVVGHAFKTEYDRIKWRNNEQEFEAWCKGVTGYPIVDAGIRELNQTGFMHNRVRMIVASFLVKHLLVDWRWGEAFFANKLLDFDLAANNGGWQWAAGSGCDAAPYFRIFNPYLQTKKFDPALDYTRKWVPEMEEFNYPRPIVDHDFARKRCLEVYSAALKKQ